MTLWLSWHYPAPYHIKFIWLEVQQTMIRHIRHQTVWASGLRHQAWWHRPLVMPARAQEWLPPPSSRLCCRDRELPEWAGLSPRLPLPQHTGPVRTSEDWRVPMLGSVEVPPSSSQVTEATLSSVSGCRPWLGTNSQTKHTNLIIYFTFVGIWAEYVII